MNVQEQHSVRRNEHPTRGFVHSDYIRILDGLGLQPPPCAAQILARKRLKQCATHGWINKVDEDQHCRAYFPQRCLDDAVVGPSLSLPPQGASAHGNLVRAPLPVVAHGPQQGAQNQDTSYRERHEDGYKNTRKIGKTGHGAGHFGFRENI